MTKTKKKKIGDKVHVTLRRFGKALEVDGMIKSVRNSYGNTEYLITGGTVGEFYARNVKNQK